MPIMIVPRRLLASLVCAAPLLLAGCAMPHWLGLGSYYAITDEASGRVYYTDNVTREARGVIEFQDAKSGARISLPAAQVREISEAEFRAGPPQVSDGPVSGGTE
jgi:hypothetical protein